MLLNSKPGASDKFFVSLFFTACQSKHGNFITVWPEVRGGPPSSQAISPWLARSGHPLLTSLCVCLDGRDAHFPRRGEAAHYWLQDCRNRWSTPRPVWCGPGSPWQPWPPRETMWTRSHLQEDSWLWLDLCGLPGFLSCFLFTVDLDIPYVYLRCFQNVECWNPSSEAKSVELRRVDPESLLCGQWCLPAASDLLFPTIVYCFKACF